MKKSSKKNWINMNEVSGFLVYSAYCVWKRKIESTLLHHDLTHVQFEIPYEKSDPHMRRFIQELKGSL